jgi:N-acetylmuramic acid 6-phosphate etherase
MADAPHPGADDALPATERANPATEDLDRLPTRELLRRIHDEDRKAVWAVEQAIDAIAQAVDAIAQRLSSGGKLHYFGAGTSGRIAVLDAAEIQPTFGAGHLVAAHIAGGVEALGRAVEGAEDDAQAAAAAVRSANIHARDAVVGISASATTPFAVAALETSKAVGALTVCITGNAAGPLTRLADIPIVLPTGPEVIAGSTRMKAAAAQKMALTMLSTAVMVKLGRVYSNVMVDMIPTNAKLRARAQRLVAQLSGANDRSVRAALEQTGYRIKPAVVMLWCHCDAAEAERRLAQAHGNLRSIPRT